MPCLWTRTEQPALNEVASSWTVNTKPVALGALRQPAISTVIARGRGVAGLVARHARRLLGLEALPHIHGAASTIDAHRVERSCHGRHPRRTQDVATHDVGQVVDAAPWMCGRASSPSRRRAC